MAKILVVDDQESTGNLIALVLGENHTVFEARNGAEGLLEFENHNPDLVITDLDMPVMNGIEMVRRVRALSREVKIIAYSTFHRRGSRAEMLSAGADLCLMKPGSLKTLEEAVANILSSNKT